MRKSLLFVIVASMLLCGCGDVYKTYEQVVKQGTDMFTTYIDANERDWKVSGTVGEPGCYLFQEFRFNEVTDYALEKGAVLLYLVDADGRDNILPYVFPVDNGRELIMQNIRFDVEKGLITLVIEYQDFKVYPQNNYKFKVCILTPGK